MKHIITVILAILFASAEIEAASVGGSPTSFNEYAASIYPETGEQLKPTVQVNQNRPGGHFGPRFGKGRPRFSPEQKAAMDACLQSKGVTPPQPPSDAEKAAFDNCRNQQNGQRDHAAFQACLSSQGVAPRQPDPNIRAAMDACRAQLGGQQ